MTIKNERLPREIIADMLAVMATNFSADLDDEDWTRGVISTLERYPISAVRAGLNRILRTRVYKGMPTLGEMVRAIEGSEEDKVALLASQAWCQVRLALKDYSNYESPPELPLLVELALAELGGLKGLNTTANDALAFRAKDFKAAYSLLLTTGLPAAEALLAPPIYEIAENGVNYLPETARRRTLAALERRSRSAPTPGSHQKKIAPPGANDELKGGE